MTRIRWYGMDIGRIVKYLIIMMVLIVVGAAVVEWITDLQASFASYTHG